MPRRVAALSPSPERKPGGDGDGFTCVDFEIRIKRRDAQSVAVTAKSASGAVAAVPKVAFPEADVRAIHEDFHYRFGQAGPGSAQISQEQATELGKRLAKVLLPPPVFQLLGRSLAEALTRPRRALRIRLEMDGDLAEMPWEYVYRPDHAGQGVSGFLLLDPKISLMRYTPRNAPAALKRLEGKQRLAFVGTLWEGHVDHWQVGDEFKLLREALKPVSEYLWLDYGLGSDDEAFARQLELGAAIFHYGGHCDFDGDGEAYLVREMPLSQSLQHAAKAYMRDIAASLKKAGTRLVVLSACNSGFWAAVRPLLDAGVPAVLGVNGSVASTSTIEFCARVYESLALGLSLDEAVGRARMHLMLWDKDKGLFDWGLFTVYTSTPEATLLPRADSASLATHRSEVRNEHSEDSSELLKNARATDGKNFGELMSECTQRRVLILGRFTGRRLKVLEAIRESLREHPNNYIGELFTYARPELRDLTESIAGYAAFSRFVIADLSEPKSIQSELQVIVPMFQSVPVVPVINETGKEYATFSSLKRRPNMVSPTLRYRNVEDLLQKLEAGVIRKAEEKLMQVRPPAD